MIPKYNIDWTTGRVQAKDIPRDLVQKKFGLWDNFVEVCLSRRGLISNDRGVIADLKANGEWDAVCEAFDAVLDLKDMVQDESERMSLLLADETIYAYAMLRWENKPIMMRYFQDALVSDNHKRVDAEASNQSGKSFSLCVKASIAFHRNHGKNYTIGLISKSMPQNSMNMRMITKMLKEAKFPYQPGSNDNMTVRVHEVDTNVTNTLVCAVASTSALGYPFDLLLLDEFEFWENPEGLEYMYDQVLEPRTFQTKGQIIIYSNPNGKNFVSENLHKRKIKSSMRATAAGFPNSRFKREAQVHEEYQFHVYNVNFLDVPGNTQEEWDTKKNHTHPIMFASTMAAERTESEGSALTDKDIQKTFDDDLDSLGFRGITQDKESYWFLDLGFVYDQSALVGCYLTKYDDVSL